MHLHRQHFYEFGPFRLDTVERLPLREAEPVPLTPKSFELLLALVVQHGRVVEKQELMQMVWLDTFVEETNLTKNIFILRQALGESTEEKYIETIPKRGYRFVARVKEIGDQSDASIVEMHAQSGAVMGPQLETSSEGRGVETELPRAIKTLTAKRWIKVGGAVVVTLFIIGTAAAKLFSLNRKPVLAETDSVLLADFVNTTGDVVFDGSTLKLALALQLEQSPFLNIFPDQQVRETLRFMKRSPDERVTPELAREVCERQGIKAWLSGSIAPLGSHYVIALEAISAHTGTVVARQQLEAESKEQVLPTLGAIATKLRAQLGESLRSIQKFDAPIEQATTSSLEAFKAFSLGYDLRLQGKFFESAPFFERAIELDPDFALANYMLGYFYMSATIGSFNLLKLGTNKLELGKELVRRAYALRERVSEWERFQISQGYYSRVNSFSAEER